MLEYDHMVYSGQLLSIDLTLYERELSFMFLLNTSHNDLAISSETDTIMILWRLKTSYLFHAD